MPESSRGRDSPCGNQTPAHPGRTNLVGVYRLEGDSFECVNAKVRAGKRCPRRVTWSPPQFRPATPPGNGKPVLREPPLTRSDREVLEVDARRHRREIGDQSGNVCPGCSPTRPNIRPPAVSPGCEDLPSSSRNAGVTGLLDQPAQPRSAVGDWKKIRHNYFSTLNDLFMRTLAKPFYEWLRPALTFEFTGHIGTMNGPHCIGVPDNMPWPPGNIARRRQPS